MTRGKYIVLEGPDGAGKTIHSKRLTAYLKKISVPVYLLREPGGTNVGEQIRSILLSPENEMVPLTELFLFSGARSQIFAEKFGVRSIPNFVLFKDGKVVEQFMGAMPAEDFEDKLNKHL